MSILPTEQIPESRSGPRLLDPIPDVVTDFYLLMHEDLRRTPRVRAFFDFIVGELKFVRRVLGDDTERVR